MEIYTTNMNNLLFSMHDYFTSRFIFLHHFYCNLEKSFGSEIHFRVFIRENLKAIVENSFSLRLYIFTLQHRIEARGIFELMGIFNYSFFLKFRRHSLCVYFCFETLKAILKTIESQILFYVLVQFNVFNRYPISLQFIL